MQLTLWNKKGNINANVPPNAINETRWVKNRNISQSNADLPRIKGLLRPSNDTPVILVNIFVPYWKRAWLPNTELARHKQNEEDKNKIQWIIYYCDITKCQNCSWKGYLSRICCLFSTGLLAVQYNKNNKKISTVILMLFVT